jgi:Pvc16 N-terminal domain
MSSALALAGVSAVLCNLLDDGMVEKVGGALGSTVSVTAIAPDIVDLNEPESPPSLNLFLYRVSPNRGWWNAGLPSISAAGDPISSPPLALDLHYLLTAYGKTNYQAEVLLGYAMQLLHQRPVLDRATLRRALAPSPLGPSLLPAGFATLDPSDLADQAESVTVTMEPHDTEEIARLWTAIQAPYRPTVGYLVSVVLIQEDRPAVAALPVLTRGPVDPVTGRDRGPIVQASVLSPFPQVTSASSVTGQPSARLGEQVVIAGSNLAGASLEVSFAHPRLAAPVTIAVGNWTDPDAVTVTLPTSATAADTWPAGTYAVTVSVQPTGDTEVRGTNAVPLAVAPVLTLPPASMTRDPGSQLLTVTVEVTPHLQPFQQVWLYLDDVGAPAKVGDAIADEITAVLPSIPVGDQKIRLQVDGVDSQLIAMTTPPTFDATQTVNAPA